MTAAYSGMLAGLTIFSSVKNKIIVIKWKKKLCTLTKSVKRGLRFIKGSDGEVKLTSVSSIDRPHINNKILVFGATCAYIQKLGKKIKIKSSNWVKYKGNEHKNKLKPAVQRCSIPCSKIILSWLPFRVNRVSIKSSLKIINPCMKFSAIVTFIKINYYLISRIHRLYSSWCFLTLGKAKKVHAFASDEWLQFGAKQ